MGAVHAYTHVCTCVCTRVCTRACTHACTHACTQAFKKDGCQLVMWNNETNEVTCRCTHLTDFALYSQIEAIKTNIEYICLHTCLL